MKCQFFTYFYLAATGMMIAPAHAFQDLPVDLNKRPDALFHEEDNLTDRELDELRGGFITSNGMVIDFVFSTNTLVNGQLVNQVLLNSADPSATGANTLRNIIQIGEGNAAFSGKIDVDSLPNILTVVQNNMDNITLQQVNLLDLSVQNLDNFIQQSIAPEIAFQSTLRLVP